jgi:hypothetical protein
MRTWKAIFRLGAVLILSGCLGKGVTEPKLVGEGRRALFIGNSYLYTLDVPGLVQALADSAGEDIAVMTVAGPDMALVDHYGGLASTMIAKGGWEWVVLQQGPSSVEVNRDTLRLATHAFAQQIEAVHATPALFSAWPSQVRRADFPRAIESYQLAASDVGGIFLPVAGAWLAAWERDETISLYSDGLHPSAAGAYLAAVVVYCKLLDKSPLGLPRIVETRGGVRVTLSAIDASTLQKAAAAALGP